MAPKLLAFCNLASQKNNLHQDVFLLTSAEYGIEVLLLYICDFYPINMPQITFETILIAEI